MQDQEIVRRRVGLLEEYKGFLDQQHYAEKFDSRSNLHSSVLEEFLYYLFRDLVASFGENALIGKSHAFKDIFFAPPNYRSMMERAHARIERKDHDFVIGVTISANLDLKASRSNENPEQLRIEEEPSEYVACLEGNSETHYFDIAAVAIECKTYGESIQYHKNQSVRSGNGRPENHLSTVCGC